MNKTIIIKLNLTKSQICMYKQICEALRKTWNLAIEIQRTIYKNGGGYIKYSDMDWYMTNKMKPIYPFINECKAVPRQRLLEDLDLAYIRYFKGLSRAPHFKSYHNPIKSIYVANYGKYPIRYVSKNAIKIPYFKVVKCKSNFTLEKTKILSGRIVNKNNNFYLHLCIDINKPTFQSNTNQPIGIDMGIKRLVTFNRSIIDTSFTNSNEFIQTYPKLRNINRHIDHYENRIRRLQRAQSKKYHVHEEMYKDEKSKLLEMRDEIDLEEYRKQIHLLWLKTYHTRNIDKLQMKINICWQNIINIRRDYERKIIKSIINNRPSYIVIEDIDIHKMVKKAPSKHIRRSIYNSRWYHFREWLSKKCNEYDIKLRIADKKFKSSKICSNCGHIHKDLKIKDRIYECPNCGYIEDRDINAAINLVNTKEYDIA